LPRSAKAKANTALRGWEEIHYVESESESEDDGKIHVEREKKTNKKWKIGKGKRETDQVLKLANPKVRQNLRSKDLTEVNQEDLEMLYKTVDDKAKEKGTELRKSERLLAKVLECARGKIEKELSESDDDSDATVCYDYEAEIKKNQSRNKREREFEERKIGKISKKKKTEERKKKGVLKLVTYSLRRTRSKVVKRVDKKKPNHHKCTLCNGVFPSSGELRVHTLKQHPLCRFLCRKCRKEFASYIGLKRHIFESHKPKKYNCKECRKTFSFQNQLTTHQRVHTDERPHICSFPSCGHSFTSVRALNTHQETFHVEGKEVHCLVQNCQLSFKTERSMKEHFRGKHGPGWTCVCGEHFTAPASYTRHKGKCEDAKEMKEKKLFQQKKK
jgi:hypothetical protein